MQYQRTSARRDDRTDGPGARKRSGPQDADLAVIDVRHHGEPKMVGVLFRLKQPAEDGSLLGLLHCHKSNQRHKQTNCPAPIDESVLHLLRKLGVSRIYCYEEDTRILRRAERDDILRAEAIQYDDRTRHCLPEQDWGILGGVVMTRASDGARHFNHPSRGLLIRAPFVRRHLIAEELASF